MVELLKLLPESKRDSMALSFATAREYDVEIVDNMDGLKALKPEWNEFASAAQVEPWQSFNWVESAAAAYGDSKHQLRIILVRKNGRIRAVAPLVLKPSDQPLRPMQLHFMGGEEIKEPNRLMAVDAASLEILLDMIVSEPVYPIRLSRIPDDHGMFNLIVRKFKDAGWITKIMSMPYPYIELTGNPIKKSLQKDLKRAEKKAKNFGEPTMDTCCKIDESQLQTCLDRAFQIEASGWKGENNTAILSNEFRKCFFEHYARLSLRDGTLRLSFLLIDNKAVAVQYAIESKQAYWLLNVGYDETYRSCSPGNLLMERSIRASVERGLTHYNLLGKEEAWTRRWTQTAIDCVVVEAYRPNLRGMKAMMSDAFYLTQKRFKENRKRV